MVIGGAGNSFCSCGLNKDSVRRTELPNMQCPNCLVYWCCINTCEQEFEYVVDVLRHQFIGHLQSSSIISLTCGHCHTLKPRRINFRTQYVTCVMCLKDMCAIDDCPFSFSSLGSKKHFVTHSDPYKCRCGFPKPRKAQTSVCPNCGAHHCLFGHCTLESVSLQGIKTHQRSCKFN